jgi:hypothetical protein
MRRLALALLCACALTAAAGSAAATKPLLGIKGDAARFQGQTGQDSVVRHAFLGWNQGLGWGSPFRSLLAGLGPVPMLALGTADKPPRDKREAISPRAIAMGQGDAYLLALNQAVSEWGRLIYVRPFAEMNGHWNLYSAFKASGAPKGPNHTTAWFKKAFARTYVILHGGSAQQVSSKLKRLGLPGISRDLATNPYPTLRVIWNPQGYGAPNIPANSAQAYYPGDAYVDVVGNDLYDQKGAAEWDANEALYKAHPSKPYSFPEWGLWGVDDPAFVQRMCDFLRTHGRTELAAYFESVAGSVFDLATKQRSRDAYRKCLTPLGGPAPAGGTASSGGTPPTPASLLGLAADPPEGDAPLPVSFQLSSNLPKVARWQLVFGDGKLAQGDGEPPATVAHTYAADGVYDAVLIVYTAPPYTGTAIRFLTHAQVKVGADAGVLLALTPTPAAGRAPLAVSFRAVANPGRPVVQWEFLPGDGSSRTGTGTPPRFLGFTYKVKGTYRAILIVYLTPPFTGTAVRLLTFADVRVS